MKLVKTLTTLAGTLAIAGCFPELPAVEDDADAIVEPQTDTQPEEKDVREDITPDIEPPLDQSETVEPDVMVDAEPTEVEEPIDVPDVMSEIDEAPDVADTDEIQEAEVTEEVVTPPECDADADCADRNTPCATWTCPAGTCVEARVDDGEPCDDSDLCTDDDACFEGVCVGTDKVCEPSSVCVVAAGCFSATGTCIETPVTEPTACDDGDPCTTNDMCGEGSCVGGPKPVADMDLQVGIQSRIAMSFVSSVVDRVDGSMTVLLSLTSGDEVNTTVSSESFAAEERGLMSYYLELDATGAPLSFAPVATPFGAESQALLGTDREVRSLTNDSLSLSGRFNGPFTPKGSTRLVGEPVVEGNMRTDGMFVAEVDSQRDLIWALTVQGALEPYPASDEPHIGEFGTHIWAPHPSGGGYVGVNMSSSGFILLRDGLDTPLRIDTSAFAIDTLSAFWHIDASGVATEFGRLTSDSGQFTLREGVALDDGGFLVTGYARDANVTLTTPKGSLAAPTASGGVQFVWLFAIDADGTPRWSRSVRVPVSGAVDETMDVRVRGMAAHASGAAVVFETRRNPVFGGPGVAAAGLIGGVGAGEILTSPWLLTELDLTTGATTRTTNLAGTALWVKDVGMDANGPIIAMQTRAFVAGSSDLSMAGGPMGPMVARPSVWARWLTWLSSYDEPNGSDDSEVGTGPHLVKSSGSGWLVISQDGIQFSQDEDLPPHLNSGVAITRLNTNNSLDCE